MRRHQPEGNRPAGVVARGHPAAVAATRVGGPGSAMRAEQRRYGNQGLQHRLEQGRPLPEALRGRMERAFGADLSAVRLHTGPRADAVGALACTQGSDIHFGPGEYRPDTPAGQALIGHELAHVLQQRAGRVPRGARVDPDAGLEQEAYDTGLRAARGEPVRLPGTGSGGGATEAPIQRKPKPLKWLFRRLGIRQHGQGLLGGPGPGAGGGGGAAAADPLDDFVAAYENARYYHGTGSVQNAQSIDQYGLLTHAEREGLPGGQVAGMSRLPEFRGDEKKGVFLGNREFMEMASRETITGPKVRLFLDANKAVAHHWEEEDIPEHHLVYDQRFPGGAVISKQSIPAEQTYYGDMTDLLDARGTPAADEKITAMLGAVGSHYTGAAPTEDQMIDLLRQAIVQRRLSNTPLVR